MQGRSWGSSIPSVGTVVALDADDLAFLNVDFEEAAAAAVVGGAAGADHLDVGLRGPGRRGRWGRGRAAYARWPRALPLKSAAPPKSELQPRNERRFIGFISSFLFSPLISSPVGSRLYFPLFKLLGPFHLKSGKCRRDPGDNQGFDEDGEGGIDRRARGYAGEKDRRELDRGGDTAGKKDRFDSAAPDERPAHEKRAPPGA